MASASCRTVSRLKLSSSSRPSPSARNGPAHAGFTQIPDRATRFVDPDTKKQRVAKRLARSVYRVGDAAQLVRIAHHVNGDNLAVLDL